MPISAYDILPAIAGMAISFSGAVAVIRYYRREMAHARKVLNDARKVLS